MAVTSRADLPHSATALERTLADVLGFGGDLESDPRDAWSPTDAPVALLPALAQSLSADRWNVAWPTDIKRAVVAGSIARHRIKGTLAAVKAMLTELGADFEIEENPSGHHTMAITINNGTFLLNQLGVTDAQLGAYIADAKRLSVSHALTYGDGALGTVGIAAGQDGISVALQSGRFMIPT